MSFTEKANKSVDEQLCTQYNILLKAEHTLDDDITLPKLVTLIEENGINSNHFKTSSKSYVFAYYRKNASTVLLDRDSLGTGKLIIRNNNVKKALGFISLHKGWVNDTTLSTETKLEFLKTRVEFSNNTVANGIEKVTADPRIMINTEKYSLLLEYASVLAANVK